MKRILGLDLGTNSIGWALIEQDFENKIGEIKGLGSRIIPMSQDILGNFEKGQSHSQTAERTAYRGTRRLYQRDNLRRDRLHRVLNILGFLPEHYKNQIDFNKKLGQFKNEVKLNYYKNEEGKFEFLFMNSFQEMIKDYKKTCPELFFTKKNGEASSIPYDWTIYYLRKKALKENITKQELAWILLNFNQKRGYYQLRGDELSENDDKNKTFEVLKVKEVIETNDVIKKTGDKLFKIYFDNGWEYDRLTTMPKNWIGKTKEFIVTTKTAKDGTIKRTFKAVDSEKDWSAIKTKTEQELEQYINADINNKTVGSFIYEKHLQQPKQKIRGKLIKTIERKYYKQELDAILEKQLIYHPELNNKKLYEASLDNLYKHNEAHKSNIKDKGFKHLFIEDIIFYQRPLKSQKGTINSCKFEKRKRHQIDKETGDITIKTEFIKTTSKSHPLFQEFRLWQWLHNLRIYRNEDDTDVTNKILPTEDTWEELFDYLREKKEIKLPLLLKYFSDKKLLPKQVKPKKGEDTEYTHRWNYPIDKIYPMCETHWSFITRLKKVRNITPLSFLTTSVEQQLWHIIYSVKDAIEYEKALKTFAKKHQLDGDSFLKAFIKYPPFKSDYSSYSLKAIKRLIPLLRTGSYWKKNNIHPETLDRIDKIITGEYDEKIRNRVREKTLGLEKIEDFKFLPIWLASYIVYDRHSELGDNIKWRTTEDINKYVNQFKQHSLRNPIVEQVILETLRTVRDIWGNFGEGKENYFDEIHVELGREMKNPAEKRKKITQRNTENERTNSRIRALLNEMIDYGAKPYSPSHQEILKIYEEDILKTSELPDEIEKINRNNSPSKKDIEKYKLWLEQKYISPYTGRTIPLNKLFSKDYQIEHIIPQSRYFDNSFSNKIICESAVNELKDNSTAFEFIKNKGGSVVNLGNGAKVEVFKWEQYKRHCDYYFKKNKNKLQNLFAEEIPEGFINRQLNDSRYISKLVKNLLSNIVREKVEQETTSKNLITVTGKITSKLKHDWGLIDKWNTLILPRFKRLNKLTNTNDFTFLNEQGIEVPTVPIELKDKFNKKRIDHRHHALDALVIASCTREHINYINSINTERKNFSLVSKLRKTEEIVKDGKKRIVAKEYLKPWKNYPVEALTELEKIVVSFKQNLRIINKANNKHWKYVKQLDGSYKKQKVLQTKGDNWAIRKPLHTPLPYGKKEYPFSIMEISKNVGKKDFILDDYIKSKLEDVIDKFNGKIGEVQKYLRKNPLLDKNNIEIKTTVFMINETRYRKRQPITKLANRGIGGVKSTRDAISFINKVSDIKIRQDLLLHLEKNNYNIDKAFSFEGIEDFNLKRRIPLFKLSISEASTKKFKIGEKKMGAKHKFGEAEGGTNLFFAVYWDDKEQKRTFDTIPLNEIIIHQKQVAKFPKELRTPVPMKIEFGEFKFSLSPNDLVYVPTENEIINPNSVDINNLNIEQINRIYKMVSCSKTQSFFIKNHISIPIKNKFEFSSSNKSERSIDGDMIKNICWKLKTDRLGNITNMIR